MIVTADWVLPVSRPPIREGAVFIRGRRIADIGTVAELTARHPRAVVNTYPGCVVLPGLVNAHTHLSLTALAGLVPSMPFPDWLRRISAATRALDADDFAASVAAGAMACLRTGATVAGDIAYGPEALSTAGDMGLGGVFFWEVLGIEAEELPAALERLEFPRDATECAGGRLRCGVSPHAPYTSGPGLLAAAHRFAAGRRAPYMVHIAESSHEVRLLVRGGGPLAPVAQRLARGFTPPRTSPVTYLRDLGVLEGAVAVHCVHITADEAEMLATRAQGVVLCPRSNRYLHNGAPPVAMLHGLGADMAVGTDSAASNDAIDLFAEARALGGLDPELTEKRLLSMLTLEGARVLGVQDLLGSLEPDKQADLVIVACAPTDDPVASVVRTGSPERVRAVMSAGAWRILDGQPVIVTTRIEAATAAVRDKAARVLARAARDDRAR